MRQKPAGQKRGSRDLFEAVLGHVEAGKALVHRVEDRRVEVGRLGSLLHLEKVTRGFKSRPQRGTSDMCHD